MRRALAALPLAVLPAAIAQAAPVLTKYRLAVNSAESIVGAVRTTAYPDGSAPTDPEASCSTWTCEALGDATNGFINESGNTLQFTAGGSTDGWGVNGFGIPRNINIAYREVASGDVQVTALIPSSWGGHVEDYTAFGVGVSDGTDASDWFFHCQRAWVVPNTVAKYGVAGDSTSEVPGASGTSLPWHVGVYVDASRGEVGCMESADGSEWAVVHRETRAMPNDYIAYVWGTSHDASATTTAEIEAAYSTTLTIAPPSSGPECGPIPSQSWTQNQSVSFNVDDYCIGDGTLTYSATGLSGLGLSISSLGVISGVPNMTAVLNSPFAVTVTATDSASRSAQAVFTAFVAPATGATHLIPVDNSQNVVIDCAQRGIQPGDTVYFEPGVRTRRHTIRCKGQPNARIYFMPPPNATEPVVFSRNGGTGDFIVRIDNSEYLTFDGTAKYIGAPSGVCGDDGNIARCGIQYWPSSENTQPSSFIKFNGTARHITLRGMGCDVMWQSQYSNTRAICFQLHDNAQLLPAGVDQLDVMNLAPGTELLWHENWIVEHTVCRNARDECRYIGTNYKTGSTDGRNYPLRNIIVRYNWDENIYSCTRLKSNIGGGSKIHDNVCIDSGIDPTHQAAVHAFQVYEPGGRTPAEGRIEVFRNIVIDTKHGGNPGGGGDCFFNYSHTRPETFGAIELWVYGNLCYKAGRHGISVGRVAGMSQFIPFIEYNTIVDVGREVWGRCIETSSGITTTGGYARHNICAGSGAEISTRNHANTNNFVSGNKAAAGFVRTTEGLEDFRLSATSPNLDAGGANCAGLTDLDGTARPQGSACDRGAYERPQ